MKRPYGTGQLYEKSGSYYGRWRTPDGRRLNRRIGSVRAAGDNDVDPDEGTGRPA